MTAWIRGQGSPPRVRSRLPVVDQLSDATGITSACAEQTRRVRSRSLVTRDHLRVCGADAKLLTPGVEYVGSPPRVRSRRSKSDYYTRWYGITSACAEQTSILPAHHSPFKDHLRVCGADQRQHVPDPAQRGSPPRVRSRRMARPRRRPAAGITSACAEQTAPTWYQARPPRDHLRVCGAD